MENRFTINNIYKSTDPKKLLVWQAKSLEHEIRFYFNPEQYVTARDNYDGTFSFWYEFEDVKQDSNNIINEKNKNMFRIIKNNLRKYLGFIPKLFFNDRSLFGSLVITFILFSLFQKNIFISLVFLNFAIFIVDLLCEILINNKYLSNSIKSKHSAEHMVCNFLEKNLRLPRNMSEIKNSSRFHKDCGECIVYSESTPYFIQSLLTTIVTSFVVKYCKNTPFAFIFAIYTVIGYIVGILIIKYKKLDFIIKTINLALGYILQCFSTTKNVKDNDIILAYYAAKCWLKIVYPEFYNKDDVISFFECEQS